MHELSIALSILDLVAEQAERQPGRIVAVHVKLGALAGVVPAALRSAFDYTLAHRFDVLVTIDKGIQYQQNMTGRRIAIVIVRGRSNRLADISPNFPACAEVLQSIQPGQVMEIGKP